MHFDEGVTENRCLRGELKPKRLDRFVNTGGSGRGFPTDRRASLLKVIERALAGVMPKSRGHRRKQRRSTPRRGGTRVSAEDLARAAAELPIIGRVDAAEARGDVRAALQLMEEDLRRRPEPEVFWSPERVGQLMQLAVLESVLPAWAYSRWILQQAVRWMDASQRGRFGRAYDRAVQIAGGPERYSGVDERDSICKLMDHDWVYRQLVLYEYGGLQHFLDRVASRSLIVRADRIRGWARTPMGAYRLVGQSARTVTWWDLVNEREVETVNIGSASLVIVEEHVIGRLVPTELGPMFESTPIVVPSDVAAQVAVDPHEWMAALERGCHRDSPPEETIATHILEFSLLSDVSPALTHVLVDRVVRPDATEVSSGSAEDVIGGWVAVVREALEDRLDVGEDDFMPWPVVGAILLKPSVIKALAREPRLGDVAAFQGLEEKLVMPAVEVCRALAVDRGLVA